LARDKQELLGAEAARRQAETELARVIHRPIDAGFAVDAAGLDGPIDFVASPRTQAFIDTPRKWAAFTAYAVETALERSAEIAQAEAAIASRRRAAAAAKRAYWLPEFALVAKSGRALDERGAGATAVPGAPDDESWSVTLQASLPLFTGGRRRAERSQALNELDAAEADGDAARDAVEARIRAALHRSAGSYPAIALSRTAATAAEENLAMVTEAYARGAVSVTELIDAQDAALEAGLGMVDAKHGFLSDFVAVLRALDEFDLLLQPEAREQWLERVERWINERVGEMPAPRR
jgi:outer membrane protein TolC